MLQKGSYVKYGIKEPDISNRDIINQKSTKKWQKKLKE